MPQLPLGPDGYVDLNVFPDGDPDQVLDPDALSSLHEALVADGDAGVGALDDGVWDQLVDSVVSGDPGVDIADILIPGEASDGPFDLSEYAGTGATADGDDGGAVGFSGDGDDFGDAVHDQVDEALDGADRLTDDRDAPGMVERDDDDGDGDADHLGDALGDDPFDADLLGHGIDDLSPFDDDHAHSHDPSDDPDDF